MSTRRYRIRTTDDLGRALAEARHAHGLTQEQLARRVAVQRTYIAKLEAGQSVLQVERLLAMFREPGVELQATQDLPDAQASPARVLVG